MDKTLWLKIAAGLSFFMAVCQTVISLSPAAAAYFQAPPALLENRSQLILFGGGARAGPGRYRAVCVIGSGKHPASAAALGLVVISNLSFFAADYLSFSRC